MDRIDPKTIDRDDVRDLFEALHSWVDDEKSNGERISLLTFVSEYASHITAGAAPLTKAFKKVTGGLHLPCIGML